MIRRRPRRRSRQARSLKPSRARRDATPACTVRFYVGSGIPSRLHAGSYRGLPASFDSRTFRARVERLVGKAFPGATYFKTRGVWKGASEDGLMVEVIASPVSGSCVRAIRRAEGVARSIARSLGQEAVLLTVTDSEGVSRQALVTGKRRQAA